MQLMGGLRGLIGGAAVIALVSACASATPQVEVPVRSADAIGAAATSSSGPVTFEDILALGEEMTAALGSGDVEQWMVLTDLDEAAAQQQRDWFAGVQAVPMQVREMHPTFLVRTDDGAGGATVRFAFRHQITGGDPTPVVELYDLTLVPRDGTWLVAGVTGAKTTGSSYPQEWDLGMITVIEGDHTIVLAGVDEELTPELAFSIDRAVGEAMAVVPPRETERLVVEFSDAAAINAALGKPDSDEWFGWMYSYPLASPEVERTGLLPDVEDGEESTPRIKVDDELLRWELEDYGQVAGGSVLVREAGLQALLLQSSEVVYPSAWLLVGLPLWFSHRGDREVWDWETTFYADYLQGDPVSVEDLSHDAAYRDPARHSYASASFIWFLEETFGADALFELADRLIDVDVSRRDADTLLDDAFTEHLGVERAQVEADWVAWAQEEFGDG